MEPPKVVERSSAAMQGLCQGLMSSNSLFFAVLLLNNVAKEWLGLS
jgi:hypothetical protein